MIPPWSNRRIRFKQRRVSACFLYRSCKWSTYMYDILQAEALVTRFSPLAPSSINSRPALSFEVAETESTVFISIPVSNRSDKSRIKLDLRASEIFFTARHSLNWASVPWSSLDIPGPQSPISKKSIVKMRPRVSLIQQVLVHSDD